MFSSSHTGRYLYPFLTWLFGPLDPVRYEFWHGLARKTGHVVGYGVLCFLYFRAWRATLRPVETQEDERSLQRWSLKWATLALILTAFVASMDEWHQSYIPSRTGTWHDVLLDSTAALVALILIRFWISRRTKSAAAKGKEEVFTTN
jgi:VanZ family protein